MNHRPDTRVHYRAEEETTGDALHGANDWTKRRGHDFWHSVWKRVERSQARCASRRRIRDMPPEAPRDYVTDSAPRV